MSNPLITVLMPAYNAQDYIRQAIDSILSQTYEEFEFIIIDDGSKDKTRKIIESYEDKRIRFISQANKGLSESCNEGIKISRGKYIARQDADDASNPDRLLKQVEYMENNPKTGLLGSNYSTINKNGEVLATTDVFTDSNDLKLAEIFSNQFGHGAVLIRKSVLEKAGYYNSHFKIAQDVDLWTRISRISKIANLKDSLYEWRSVGEGLSTSAENIHKTIKEAYEIRDREFKYYLSNKEKYKLLSFKPTSINAGVFTYLRMKNSLLRDMALMYCYSGLRRSAAPILILGIIYAPWVTKTYRQLFITVFKKAKISTIGYEYI